MAELISVSHQRLLSSNAALTDDRDEVDSALVSAHSLIIWLYTHDAYPARTDSAINVLYRMQSLYAIFSSHQFLYVSGFALVEVKLYM